jgi:hypothetical protein
MIDVDLSQSSFLALLDLGVGFDVDRPMGMVLFAVVSELGTETFMRVTWMSFLDV